MMNDFTIVTVMIPFAGPFFAVMFPVVWTLVVDPDSAFDLSTKQLSARYTPRSQKNQRHLVFNQHDGELIQRMRTISATNALVKQNSECQPQRNRSARFCVEVGGYRGFLAFIMAQETPATTDKAPMQNWPTEDDKPSEVELVSPSITSLTRRASLLRLTE